MTDVAQRARISERFTCEIAVSACTTLENRPARIVDLSEHGAKVSMDQPYEQGARIHLDVDGDFVWATVAWAEVDRMGLRFTAPLAPGHRLHARLAEARRGLRRVPGHVMAMPARPAFGRRAA